MPFFLFDQHIHTEFSFDCSTPVSAVAETAKRSGLFGITITDHCDLGAEELPDREERLMGSLAAARALGEELGDSLFVGAGLELGQPLHDRKKANAIINSLRDVDFVLGALHNTRAGEDFYELCKDENADLPPAFTRYFEEILEMVQWARFDSLAHLTYPYRYDYKSVVSKVPPIGTYEDILREIFKTMAKNGLALEINVSGPARRGPSAAVMPTLNELRLFKECGGEFVTIGSDAHIAEDIGDQTDLGLRLAKAVGIRWQAVFKGRTIFPEAID